MRHSDEPRESGGPAGAGRKGSAELLTVKVEFVVVEGEEAKLVAARQTAAIRTLLEWVAESKDDAERYNSS